MAETKPNYDALIAELTRIIGENPDDPAYANGIRDALGMIEKAGLAKLSEDLEAARAATRWRKLGDEKPSDGEDVIAHFERDGLLMVGGEARYNEHLGWTNDNWNSDIATRPDDLWLPMPQPPTAPSASDAEKKTANEPLYPPGDWEGNDLLDSPA